MARLAFCAKRPVVLTPPTAGNHTPSKAVKTDGDPAILDEGRHMAPPSCSLLGYRSIRSSPTRRVMRFSSRYPARARAYLRLVPNRSRIWATVIVSCSRR